MKLELILEHVDWIHSLAHSLVFDPGAADDIAQETWLAALKKPPESESNLRSWFVSVLHNQARSLRRAEARRLKREVAASKPEEISSTLNLVEKASLQRKIAGIVLELEEPYRSMVLLRYFEGLQPREIAEKEKLNVEVVHTRLHRALAQLRSRLDREYGNRENWCLHFFPLAALVKTEAKAFVAKQALVKWFSSFQFQGIAAVLFLAVIFWRVGIFESPAKNSEKFTASTQTESGKNFPKLTEISRDLGMPNTSEIKTENLKREQIISEEKDPVGNGWIQRGPNTWASLLGATVQISDENSSTFEEEKCWVRGKVVDPFGMAVPNASVFFGSLESKLYEADGLVVAVSGRFVTPSVSSSYSLIPGTVKTNDEGEFCFRSEQKIREDFCLFAVAPGYFPARLENFGARLKENPQAGNDVILQLSERALSISAKALDSEGNPLKGFTVTLEDRDFAEALDFYTAKHEAGEKFRELQIDEEGNFRISGLAAKSYRFRFINEDRWVCFLSELIPAGSSNVEIRMPKNAVREKTQFQLVTRQGMPISGAEVSRGMRKSGNVIFLGNSSTGSEPFAISDAQGRFELSQLSRAEMLLKLQRAGFRDRDFYLDPKLDGEFQIVMSREIEVQLILDPQGKADSCEVLNESGELVDNFEILRQYPDMSYSVIEGGRILVFLDKNHKELNRALIPYPLADEVVTIAEK